MFIWKEFSDLALTTIEGLAITDEQLRSILSQSNPPIEKVNEYGRPLPGSAVICQHPDIRNYKRIIEIRKQLAREKAEADYVSYADRVQGFLESTPDSFALFVVLVATRADLYEFLFVPETRKVFVSAYREPAAPS